MPLCVEGDGVRLTQAISNLLHNAAKYTPQGGTIRLTMGAEDGHAIVRVIDSGVGIEPQLLPTLFDLFVQGDRSLDRSEGGLGIGLTVARALAEMHGGTIEASSGGPGRGSEFVIRLPLCRDHRQALADSTDPGPVPDSPTARAPPRRILLVEDNPDAAASLVTLLELEGHAVRKVRSGEEALELAGAFGAEVVLLDLGLPGMDGYETARRLRDHSSFAGAAFVALTGYGRDQDLAQSRAAGFTAHLLKPVVLDDLRRALDQLPRPHEALTRRSSASGSTPRRQ